MHILLIEDDQNKRQQLMQIFGTRHTVESCGSYRSGLTACLTLSPNLLILDMTLPTYDYSGGEYGGRIRHFGGRDILKELSRRRIYIPTIVVTGFDVIGDGNENYNLRELETCLRESFPESFRGIVHYAVSEVQWRDELASLVRQLETSRCS